MNVARLAADVPLDPLVYASQAEGFRFVERLRLELAAGDFKGPGTVLFGKLAEQNLVGVGGLTADPYPGAEPGVGRLRHLYVLPSHRCQGVGKELVLALVEEARLHYRALRLRTDTPEAACFYETLGFCACTEPNATHRLDVV